MSPSHPTPSTATLPSLDDFSDIPRWFDRLREICGHLERAQQTTMLDLMTRRDFDQCQPILKQVQALSDVRQILNAHLSNDQPTMSSSLATEPHRDRLSDPTIHSRTESTTDTSIDARDRPLGTQRSRGVKRARDTRESLDSEPDASTSDDRPTVVSGPNGTLVELRCPVCNGNASLGTGKQFKGAHGLGLHIKRSHNVDIRLTSDEIIAISAVHTLTVAEAAEFTRNATTYHVETVLGNSNPYKPTHPSSDVFADFHRRDASREVINAFTIDDDAQNVGEIGSNKHARADEGSHWNSTDNVIDRSHVRRSTNMHPTNGDKPQRKRDTRCIHSDYPTVVPDSGSKTGGYGSTRWIELRCYVCGSNYSRSRGAFFAGRDGMADHLRAIHKVPVDTMAEEVKRCEYHVLSGSEVDQARWAQFGDFGVPRIDLADTHDDTVKEESSRRASMPANVSVVARADVNTNTPSSAATEGRHQERASAGHVEGDHGSHANATGHHRGPKGGRGVPHKIIRRGWSSHNVG